MRQPAFVTLSADPCCQQQLTVDSLCVFLTVQRAVTRAICCERLFPVTCCTSNTAFGFLRSCDCERSLLSCFCAEVNRSQCLWRAIRAGVGCGRIYSSPVTRGYGLPVEHSTVVRSAHAVYLCVLCCSQNKHLLFPYTASTDWFS